jgi:hypothetical protein
MSKNHQLNAEQLQLAWALIKSIRRRLDKLANGDRELRFAFNRKVAKELMFDERGTATERKKLKAAKLAKQRGRCALCRVPLPARGAVLDRKRAADGYTAENTRLLCVACDQRVQQRRRYS